MTSPFDDAFKELEQSVMADMRSVYTEKTIDQFLNPRNLGQIEAPDGFASVTGSCGDTMEIYLKVNNERIVNVTFWTDGCGPSIASGSMITELVKGKSIVEARKITQRNVLDALGGLPEESLHCALLASDTLREAIRDYQSFRNEPWKRAYRR